MPLKEDIINEEENKDENKGMPNLNIDEISNSLQEKVEEEKRRKISDNKMVASTMEDVHELLNLSKYFSASKENASEIHGTYLDLSENGFDKYVESYRHFEDWNNHIGDLMAGGMIVADNNGNILTDEDDVSERLNKKHENLYLYGSGDAFPYRVNINEKGKIICSEYPVSLEHPFVDVPEKLVKPEGFDTLYGRLDEYKSHNTIFIKTNDHQRNIYPQLLRDDLEKLNTCKNNVENLKGTIINDYIAKNPAPKPLGFFGSLFDKIVRFFNGEGSAAGKKYRSDKETYDTNLKEKIDSNGDYVNKIKELKKIHNRITDLIQRKANFSASEQSLYGNEMSPFESQYEDDLYENEKILYEETQDLLDENKQHLADVAAPEKSTATMQGFKKEIAAAEKYNEQLREYEMNTTVKLEALGDMHINGVTANNFDSVKQSVMGSLIGSDISENNKEVFAMSLLMMNTRKSNDAMKTFNDSEALQSFMKTKAFNNTFNKLKGKKFDSKTPALKILQEEIIKENSEIALTESKKTLKFMANEIGSHAVNGNTIREVAAYLTLKDVIESNEAIISSGNPNTMKGAMKELMTTMSQLTGDHPESLKQYENYLKNPKLEESINEFKGIKAPVPVTALTGKFIGEKNKQLRMRNSAYNNANGIEQ